MSAEVLAFPPARRVGYIRRQAQFVLSMNAESGERHIARQLSLQRQVLASKGVSAETVEAEIRELESAIRSALWRAVFEPPGAA